MKIKRRTLSVWINCGLGLAGLILLAGCTNTPLWGRWSHSPSAEEMAAAHRPPVPPARTLAQVTARN